MTMSDAKCEWGRAWACAQSPTQRIRGWGCFAPIAMTGTARQRVTGGCRSVRRMARSRDVESQQRACSVTLILASRPNVYSSHPARPHRRAAGGSGLDRDSSHDPDTLFVPVWRTRNLVRGVDEGAPEAVYHLRRNGAHAAHAGRALGVPRHPGRARGLRHRHQRAPTTRCRCCRRTWARSSICARSAGACRGRRPRCWRMRAG